ncbi:neurophysin 1-like [Polypterus senegalus]|uniref:neurophysin 1-like n=1 Tax=Polypterus senegalus TaxID=55291 RepID=UPI001964CAF8|nr:neurophysin 1-like [Polypterus senegalus]
MGPGGQTLEVMSEMCMPCGPDNKGRCFGPSICCSEELGCYIGTSESARCLEESFLSSPCEASGRVCGLEEDGHCAAPGICCDEESCHMDAICSQGEIYSSHLDGGMSTQGEFVLRLLHLADRQSERK